MPGTLKVNLDLTPYHEVKHLQGHVLPGVLPVGGTKASQVAPVVKNLPAATGDVRDAAFSLRVRKIS